MTAIQFADLCGFKAVSKSDQALLVAQGHYTKDGQRISCPNNHASAQKTGGNMSVFEDLFGTFWRNPRAPKERQSEPLPDGTTPAPPKAKPLPKHFGTGEHHPHRGDGA